MLSNLEKYMFSNENIIKHNIPETIRLKKKILNTSSNVSAHNSEDKQTNNNYIIPDEIDKLFWCFYISLNGFDKYLLEKTGLFKIEKEFKINVIQKLREIKTQLKALKLKLNEIENDLVNNKYININTLHALALNYNMSFIVLVNNIYYDFNYNNNNYFLIESIDKHGYCLYIQEYVTKEKINEIKENYYLVDSSKPIKSISSYTLNELQQIASKLKINDKQENGKNKVKKELYENIIQKLGKLM
jgi:hypothetical protein